jgi:hypothetical protein
MDFFKQSILELENRKINAPIYGQYNYTFRFAYQNLLQEMYNRDLSNNQNFTDPQYNYSNNIVNNIINRIADTTKTFVFDNYSEQSLLYLQSLPQKSQNYISLLNSIVLNRYVFDNTDEWNIKYYYIMLKFIPIYFELTLGLFNTPHIIRNKHIACLNNIMDKKIILGLEEYTTYNFWIKDMFRNNSNLVVPFIKIIESINIDPNIVSSKVMPEKSNVVIPKEQNKELVVDKSQQLFKVPVKKSDQLEKIELTINTKIDIITKKLDKLNKLNTILEDTKEIKKISKTNIVEKQKKYDYHELEAYTIISLKKECVNLGLPQSGLKQDIIRRLVEYNN